MYHICLRSLALLALLALLPALTACVERKITIASDPPGALVYVNDVEIGRTPVTFPFLWYGDYDIRLRLDRNEGTPEEPKMVQYYLHTNRRATAPAYEWIGPDLVAEMLPVDFKDQKIWAFNIPAVPQPSDEQLVANAKETQKLLDQPTGLEKPIKKKK